MQTVRVTVVGIGDRAVGRDAERGGADEAVGDGVAERHDGTHRTGGGDVQARDVQPGTGGGPELPPVGPRGQIATARRRIVGGGVGIPVFGRRTCRTGDVDADGKWRECVEPQGNRVADHITADRDGDRGLPAEAHRLRVARPRCGGANADTHPREGHRGRTEPVGQMDPHLGPAEMWGDDHAEGLIVDRQGDRTARGVEQCDRIGGTGEPARDEMHTAGAGFRAARRRGHDRTRDQRAHGRNHSRTPRPAPPCSPPVADDVVGSHCSHLSSQPPRVVRSGRTRCSRRDRTPSTSDPHPAAPSQK